MKACISLRREKCVLFCIMAMTADLPQRLHEEGGNVVRRYVLRRFLQLIPVLIGITFLSFALMRLAGSDAVQELYTNAGAAASQEVIDARRAELGLDKPFLQQYMTWLGVLAAVRQGKLSDYVLRFCSFLGNSMPGFFVALLLMQILSIHLGWLPVISEGTSLRSADRQPQSDLESASPLQGLCGMEPCPEQGRNHHQF